MLRDSGGALGEDLRLLAVEGQDEELRQRLKNVANTASQDDLGITPLMYAVRKFSTGCNFYCSIDMHAFGTPVRCGMDTWSA